MTVDSKRAAIAVLRTMGARRRSILGLFLAQGMLVAIAGSILGTVGGLLLARHVSALVEFIERRLDVDFMSAEIYLLDKVPSQLLWSDVLIVNLLTLTLGLLAAVLPAWRAMKVHPAQALRYE